MEGYFSEIEIVTEKGKLAIEEGKTELIGEIMSKNHELLNSIGVGHEKLDELIDIANKAGAVGSPPVNLSCALAIIAVFQKTTMIL